MGELPFLVLLKVLNYLPTVDTTRCRAVCKLWRSFIDQFVHNELNVFHNQRQYTKYFQLQKRFSNLNKSISFERNSALERVVLENEQFARLFKNLKKFSFIKQLSFLNFRNHRELEKLISMS